jgi:hypothetical protein
MRTSSAKQKGRKLQDFVRDIFRDIFRNSLEKEDITSRIMGCSGTDINFSPQASKLIPFAIEAKNQEKFSINASLKQCESNTLEGRIPLLVFSKNRDDVYVALKFTDFINLIYPDWQPTVKINKKSVIPLENVENTQKNEEIV